MRTARVARGLTQRELAAPYTAAFVSRIEHGDAIPSLSSLEVLTARMAISLEEFFRLVEEQDVSGRAHSAQQSVARVPITLTHRWSDAEASGSD